MNTPKTGNADNLPILRSNLSVAFNDYDLSGNPQWLIHDAGRNKFFLIGWLEYEIYERWHLGTATAIIDSINTNTTLHADKSDIDNFVSFLKRNYLIKLSGYDINKQAHEQELFKNDSRIHWLISNYLFFRIPLVHPDKFLEKTQAIGKFLFNRYTLYFMSFLAVIALYQISLQWEQFTHTFSSIFTWQGLLYSMLAFTICKLCHELGHAYMCKSFGVPVPTLGIAFLVFWPVLYTDTTLSWSLNNKKRLRIALAGIWVETYITIIAALIWCNTSNLTLQTICYVTITVNWLASLLINVSPFMRFDGYYVLADYLKMPNLQFRAFALTRWQLRRWLFGWQDPPPEKLSPYLHNFLIAYSIATWLYRLVLYLGIAVLVYHFFAKVVGIILFIIEIYYFVLNPIILELKTWYLMREHFSLNTRTKTTLIVTSLMVIAFFLPVNTTVKLPSTMSYTHQFLFAPEAGILMADLPPSGTKIEANQPIATLDSTQLNQAIHETILEYDKTVSQFRRAGVNPAYSVEKNILLSNIKKLKAEYKKLISTKDKLTLRVPFNGILIETSKLIRAGSYVMKGQWIGDVIRPDKFEIEAFVTQPDNVLVEKGETGYFYPYNFSLPAIPVKVESIEVLNAKELDCRYSGELKQQKDEDQVIETPCYHASELGGEIPTYQTDEGRYVPTGSVFRIILTTSDPIRFNHVERGTVFINTKPQSYASRLIYKIKSLLVGEASF